MIFVALRSRGALRPPSCVFAHGQEMKLVKEYHDAMAESAGRLAPYIHPRLAAVEVKTEQPQSFVICVPEVETDSEQ